MGPESIKKYFKKVLGLISFIFFNARLATIEIGLNIYKVFIKITF